MTGGRVILHARACHMVRDLFVSSITLRQKLSWQADSGSLYLNFPPSTPKDNEALEFSRKLHGKQVRVLMSCMYVVMMLCVLYSNHSALKSVKSTWVSHSVGKLSRGCMSLNVLSWPCGHVQGYGNEGPLQVQVYCIIGPPGAIAS